MNTLHNKEGVHVKSHEVSEYDNHELQTNPRHREEEPQDIIYNNTTSERQ